MERDDMKRMMALLLVLACCFALGGCGENLDDKSSVAGFIKEIRDHHILIATSTAEGHPYGASFDIVVNIADCKEIYDPLQVGDEIIVSYDGNITGTNPSQIHTVYAVARKVPADK